MGKTFETLYDPYTVDTINIRNKSYTWQVIYN